MGFVNVNSFNDWDNGDIITSEQYEQERSLIITAVNDNWDRIIKNIVVQNSAGTQIATYATGTDAVLKFREGANVDISVVGNTLVFAYAPEAGSVATAAIADSAVTTLKIANGAVTSLKLADGSVLTAKVADGAITTAKIADGAVTEAKIGTGAVTATKIGAEAVTEAKIGPNAVTNIKIASDAVTADKIATGAVGSDEIASDAVTSAKIATGAVTTSKLGTGAVATTHIADSAVTSAKIASGAVTSDKLDPAILEASPQVAAHASDPNAHSGIIGSLASLVTTVKTNLVAAINEVKGIADQAKTAASDLKTKVAAAITGMGQAASATDTSDQLAAKISAISTDATAVEAEVLAGRTFYKGGKKTGTMPNQPAQVAPTSVAAAGGSVWVRFPMGAYLTGGNGGQPNPEIKVDDPDFIAANILANKNIFGLQGSIPNRAGGSYSASSVTISGSQLRFLAPEGYYDGTTSTLTASDVDFIAANIPADKNIFGLQGSIPVLGSEEFPGWRRAEVGPALSMSGRVHLRMPLGYYRTGTSEQGGLLGVFADDPDFIASNIRSGTNIFGLTGTLSVRYYAEGNYTPNGANTHDFTHSNGSNIAQNYILITNLGFTPHTVVARKNGTGSDVDVIVYHVWGLSSDMTMACARFTSTSAGWWKSTDASGVALNVRTGGGFILPTGTSGTNYEWRAWGTG